MVYYRTALRYHDGLIELPEVGVNANRTRNYTAYYDGKTRDMVARVASGDMRRFGYHYET